jgi:uncharacterized protein YjbJ (UPF0337 family)
MGLISKVLKTGLVLGAVVTAAQAASKSITKDGNLNKNTFMKNFKEQAMENGKYVVDTVKSQLAGQDGGYKVDSEGENGYTYVDAEPVKATPAEPAAEPAKEAPAEPAAEPAKQGDVVDEVFETMKEKAPEVIGKVQDIVEDVRENAPEYKARAQEFVEDVKEAAKKALDKDDKGE